MKKIALLILFITTIISTGYSQKSKSKFFVNPLLPSGADPFSFYKDGYYYYTQSMQNKLVLWKTKDLTQLKLAETKTVWIPPQGTMYSKELWAPEIHFIQGKWYLYFAADNGENTNHRMYVLENNSSDPLQGEWIFKGKVADTDDKWAIDGDVFEHKGGLYMIWSGWEGDINVEQNIYIAKMKNPWTIEGNRSKISGSDYDWEKNGDIKNDPTTSHVNVNEGPQILKHKNKLFLVYSASGCWTDFYALGMLTCDAKKDLLKPDNWKKSPQPVFKQSLKNKVFAPGHNSFFKSPNGKEDWILYHANSESGQGCGIFRSPRAQKISWKKNGMPNFGRPLSTQTRIVKPAY